jgi:hypothetical protein
MKTLKKVFVLVILAITLSGALSLSRMFPQLPPHTLIGLSLGIIAVVYLIFKIGSLLLKLLLLAAIIIFLVAFVL